LNWIGGVLGISGDAKSVTGSTPFIFRDKEIKSEMSAKNWLQEQVISKNSNRKWQ